MLTIIQYPLETGIVIALVVYGLILAWSLLARLKWLPGALRIPVHHVLDRLGRVPFLGRAVRAARRHPLSLGLVAAILVGILVPSLVISLAALIIALTFMAGVYVVIRYGGDGAAYHFKTPDEVMDKALYGDPLDYGSYDSDWMAAEGKLPRA